MSVQSNDPRITAYLLGEMSADEMALFEAEVSSSQEAQKAVGEMRALISELKVGYKAELKARPIGVVKKYGPWFGALFGIVGVTIWIFSHSAMTPEPTAVKRIAKILLDPPPQLQGEVRGIKIELGGKEAIIPAGLNKLQIENTFWQHVDEIRKCHYDFRDQSSRPSGNIGISFSLSGGKVENVETQSDSLGNERLANCIHTRMKTWSFPPTNKPVSIVFPVRFIKE